MRKTQTCTECFVKSLPQIAKLSSAELPIAGDLHAKCQKTFLEMMCVCATRRMNMPRVTCKSEVTVFKAGSDFKPNENEGTGCNCKTDTLPDTQLTTQYTNISN